MLPKLSPLLLVGFLSLMARHAHADVPPPDRCNEVGADCNVAGPDYKQPGKCIKGTCSRATPSGPVTYECNRCVLADSGAGGATSSTGGTTSTGGAESTGGTPASSGGSPAKDEKTEKKSDNGCTISPRGSTGAAFPLALGLGALLLRRRQGKRAR